MSRDIIIKHMNNAFIMQEEMRKDNNLKLTYSDYDFDKFIDRCRELLAEEWHEPPNGLVVPF